MNMNKPRASMDSLYSSWKAATKPRAILRKILSQGFLACGRILTKLKVDKICFIPKGGHRAEWNTYRAVSLNSLVSKVMKGIVRRRLTMFLEENDPAWLPFRKRLFYTVISILWLNIIAFDGHLKRKPEISRLSDVNHGMTFHKLWGRRKMLMSGYRTS